MTIEQEVKKPAIDNYIELFEIDTNPIGDTLVFRFTPNVYTATEVVWRGDTYQPFPIDATGFEYDGTSAAPPKPNLTVSNVNRILMAAVLGLGDLVGAQVTRYRTFKKYLDGQAEADPNAVLPPDVLIVEQKHSHTKSQISWSLISPLDRPNLMLPKRQVLRDLVNNYQFPGAGRFRSGL